MPACPGIGVAVTHGCLADVHGEQQMSLCVGASHVLVYMIRAWCFVLCDTRAAAGDLQMQQAATSPV